MRTENLALAALLIFGPGRAEAAADRCSFVTTRNRVQCLGTVLVPASSVEDEVALDGVVIGKGPLLLHDLVPGRHVVDVTGPDGVTRRHTVAVRRGRVRVLPTRRGASLGRPGAPPFTEVYFGYTDECDGIFHRTSARVFPVDIDRLEVLRRDGALAAHLPTLAVALARVEKRCEAGEALACRQAGASARQGAGQQASSPTRSAELFRRGCDLNDNASCVELADQLESGWGVERDEAAANALRERLCSQGHAASCRKLGVTLAFSAPSPKSRERALSLLQKACEGGDPAGCSLAAQVLRLASCDRDQDPQCAAPGGP